MTKPKKKLYLNPTIQPTTTFQNTHKNSIEIVDDSFTRVALHENRVIDLQK
jgi:hypothetical protein